MDTQKNKLEWVQALRGLAAFMVVTVHSRSVLMDTGLGRAVADHVLLPMAMGVDLFFIISGFLMVWTTRDFDGTKTYLWKFLAKRFARIWPLFAVMAPIALVVEHGFAGFRDASVALSYLEGLAFIPHNPGASGIYFQMAVGVAWTLCFEWYFYLVFAASMFLGRRRYMALIAWFALTLLVIPISRGGYNLNVAAQPLVAWSRYANLAINPIVWDFVVGMAAGWLYGSRIRIKQAGVVYAVASLLLVLLLVTWRRIGMVNFFGPHGWGAPLAILFVSMVPLAKADAIKVPKWSVWMGNISYSLYLVHVYVFEILQRIAADMPLSHKTLEVALFVTRPIVAVICAWLMFRCIEAPLSVWVRKRLLNLRMPWRLEAKSAVS
ncbi:acyltransferase family protein [Dyella nitratireducens]|uniref:Acyltransferase n=1 Tax=Dyella nitratireducens TaxID=1849580 RepID=A0ABQ1GE61_9GAMM|nr:acyltransferase [Dyella nitratireducens]GGA41921.1 acyltransferase [Dyella nitratireducens]GLQ42077.1 acyltransferase [Dyella nitratireducens]